MTTKGAITSIFFNLLEDQLVTTSIDKPRAQLADAGPLRSSFESARESDGCVLSHAFKMFSASFDNSCREPPCDWCVV